MKVKVVMQPWKPPTFLCIPLRAGMYSTLHYALSNMYCQDRLDSLMTFPQTATYDLRDLHPPLIIIRKGQELIKKNRSTIMLISKSWFIKAYKYSNKHILLTADATCKPLPLKSLNFLHQDSLNLWMVLIPTTTPFRSLFAYLQKISTSTAFS